MPRSQQKQSAQARSVPRLTLSVCLPNLTFLSHMIPRALAFHKVTPGNTLLSHLEPRRYCFPGLNSRSAQNFTTLGVEIQCQGVPGLGQHSCNSLVRGAEGLSPFCHFLYRN